ncbi:hypothetical protein IQ230_23505 [Gloeocapsopsis crepidinum LEGE 06123]|uniref:Uncharacterized protein n=1 Tax=Gloeocapsopsis crepidinum LEGE 06123 TaxID=588587 RepID=A0ABR9UY75_9CHRO|nr:hypothetical protein [Gloeocapsopsis crepidinum]MBE9193257.1 hypothetical protein [Gloeocapsopsis crepidinum LEGE 06123]
MPLIKAPVKQQFDFYYDQQEAPTNPAIGDIWKERDSSRLLIQEWFWNGTYWLSSAEVVFTQNLNLGSLSSTVNPVIDFTVGQAIDRQNNLFITRYIFSAFMGSSSSANYTTRIGVSTPWSNISSSTTYTEIPNSASTTGTIDGHSSIVRTVANLNFHLNTRTVAELHNTNTMSPFNFVCRLSSNLTTQGLRQVMLGIYCRLARK